MKILCFIIVVLRRKEKKDNFYNESTERRLYEKEKKATYENKFSFL